MNESEFGTKLNNKKILLIGWSDKKKKKKISYLPTG